MNFPRLALLLIAFNIFSFVYGQTIQYKNFGYKIKTLASGDLEFSFDIPAQWKIQNETDGTGYFLNATSTDSNEARIYNDCHQGFIFKIKYFNTGLDSALMQMGVKHQSSNIYQTTVRDKIRIITTLALKGETFTGVEYFVPDDVDCVGKTNKTKGGYHFIYLSNGSRTIGIQTFGKRLDTEVRERLLKSFRFK